MRVLILIAALLVAGCKTEAVRPNPPAPEVIQVMVKTYVPVDRKFTRRCPWRRDGKPSEVFDVADSRRRCLEKYELQFDAIDVIEGTPVPDTD